MNIVEKKAKSKNSNGHSTMVCRHCGGKVRFYLGDYSCLMCGREIGHTCKGCPSVK